MSAPDPQLCLFLDHQRAARSSVELRAAPEAVCWQLGLCTGPKEKLQVFLSFGRKRGRCGHDYFVRDLESTRKGCYVVGFFSSPYAGSKLACFQPEGVCAA